MWEDIIPGWPGISGEISPEDLTVTADTIRRVLKIMNELDIHTYEMERKDEEKK